jgi:hypothetical protein
MFQRGASERQVGDGGRVESARQDGQPPRGICGAPGEFHGVSTGIKHQVGEPVRVKTHF